MSDSSSRRSFLQKFAAGAAVTAAAAAGLRAASPSERVHILQPAAQPTARIAPNDRVRIGTIGMGIIGFIDTDTALRVPGVELVAASDLYEGRRTHVQEVYGPEVQTYVDYRELLARDDIDAVLVCVPDHWHAQIAVDAMRAGKAVYCEKPMVKDIAEGPDVIGTQKDTGAVFQVGSQYASSILYDKARELYMSGAIGELMLVKAAINRNSAIGAWQYSIPLDASEETVDWDRFLGEAPERPFDPVRFFRWRNYSEYGTGVAGDLYVHLFTGIHHVLGALGPTHVVSQGGVRYWTDGRDAPDVMLGLFDYPEGETHPVFTVALQTNFVDGSGDPGMTFQFMGSEGELRVEGNRLILRQAGLSEPTIEQIVHGYNSVRTFSNAQQAAYEAHLRANREAPESRPEMVGESTFATPDGYDDRFTHFTNFFASIREDKPVYEDAAFGYRAAAPALLGNMSLADGKIYTWDPVGMRLVSS